MTRGSTIQHMASIACTAYVIQALLTLTVPPLKPLVPWVIVQLPALSSSSQATQYQAVGVVTHMPASFALSLWQILHYIQHHQLQILPSLAMALLPFHDICQVYDTYRPQVSETSHPWLLSTGHMGHFRRFLMMRLLTTPRMKDHTQRKVPGRSCDIIL